MSVELEAWRKAWRERINAEHTWVAVEGCDRIAEASALDELNRASQAEVCEYRALSPEDRAVADKEKERGG